MKMKDEIKNISKCINNFDRIQFYRLVNDESLMQFIRSCRKASGIPIEGFDKKKPIGDYKCDFKKIIRMIVNETPVILVCYNLPPNWGISIQNLIMFNEAVAPDMPVKISRTSGKIDIEILGSVRSLSLLDSFLDKNGLVSANLKKYVSVVPRKVPNLDKYSFGMRLCQLKERKVPSKEIVKLLRAEFSKEQLPDPLRKDLTSDTAPENCIDQEYLRIQKKLKQFKETYPDKLYRRAILRLLGL